MTSSTPFCIVHESGQEMCAFPKEFEGLYRQSFFLTLIADLKRSLFPESVLEWYLNEYQFLAVADLCDGHYLVTAPVSAGIFDIGRHRYLEYVRPGKADFFAKFLQDIPSRLNFSLSRIVMLGKHLYSGINIQGKVSIKYFSSDEIVPLKHEDMDSSRNLPTAHMKTEFCSRFHLQTLESCIKRGDYMAFSMAYHRPVSGLFGTISRTSIQQTRYSYILLLYMIACSACEGGMPFDYCLELFSHYCLKMEGLNDISEIEKLKMIAADDYCKKVAQCQKEKNYHKATKEAMRYIHKHLYEKIKIQEISEYVHLNRSTLSAYFKQDTWETILEYLNHVKLTEAKYLLEEHQNNYQYIIDTLGFCSQSYFIQKFRAYFGITPQQYLELVNRKL